VFELAPSNAIERKPLSSIAEIFSGLPTYRLKHGSVAIPVVTIKDIDHASDARWQLSSVQVPDPDRLLRFRLKPGDVVITSRGTTLRSCVVSAYWNGAVLGSNLIGIRVGGVLRAEVLAEFLNSKPGKQAIERRLVGSNLLLLTTRSLGELEVPVPPLDEQAKLAELICAAEAQYQMAIAAAAKRREITHRIVLHAFRGKKAKPEERE
jgi:type I restriction enzyme M protein